MPIVTTLAASATPEPAGILAPILFYSLSLLVLASAWAIVASNNIVRMSIYLLLTLAGVAGLYLTLGAELLAAVQLIVYAGGTLILIIFGVMLTNRDPFKQLSTRPIERLAALLIGLAVAAVLLVASWGRLAASSSLEAIARQDVTVESLGRLLLTRYVLVFEVAAVLLLLVMVAAAYLARRKA
ncbi:MAG: NADH-quinone oxidoreductase subunit J [Phycisphaeraceae bacterium]|nr:NADH-quinone oxidoreductase subunit J [Phycisphaeraceae bacterium]